MGQTTSTTSAITNVATTSQAGDYISYSTSAATPTANVACQPFQTSAPPLVIPNVGTIFCRGVTNYYDNCCVLNSISNYGVSVNYQCQQQYAPSNCIQQAQTNLVNAYCNCERSAQPKPTPTPPATTCILTKPTNLSPCENGCWSVDYRVSRLATGCFNIAKVQACTTYCNNIKPLANDLCKKVGVYPNSQAGYGVCAYLTVNFPDLGSTSSAAGLYNAVIHDMSTTSPTLCGKETCCVKGCNITLNNQVQAYGGPAINEYQMFENCINSCDPHEICPPPTGPNVPLSQYCNCGIPADCW